jgi:LuxR family maltose regulon positive regulatory protein
MPPWISNLMAAWRARIWLAEDRLDAVSQWVQERGLDVAGDLEYLREMEYVVLARLLIAQGRLDEGAKLLQRLFKTVEPRGHTAREIEILNLQALAFQAKDDPAQAMIPLERALTLAEPGGLIRTFVDEGPPMAQLLYGAAVRGTTPDYTAKLLAALEDVTVDEGRATMDRELAVSSVVHRAPSALVEPLSERELEVLELIAEGLTNPEIASRLYLSVNTVKVHARNIYGKLNVRRRTQAIARSQELGLLPRR